MDTDQSDAPPPDVRSRTETALVMISLCSALFLSALDVTIVTVAVPTMAAHFRSTVGYTWVGSSYLLANAATAPSWGKVSDIWGRKPVLLAAVAVFWLGSLLCGVSQSMAMLLVARAVQGTGGGGILILVNVCIGDLFSMRRRAQYFGLAGMVWALAGGIGPVVGGALTQHVSWRWCFFLNLPISGAGFVLLVFVLRLPNPQTSVRDGLRALDVAGSLLVTAGTLLVLLGLTLGGVQFAWSSAPVVVPVVVGTLLLVAFAWVEARWARYPVVPLHLFRSRVAAAAFACCFCHGAVFVAGTYYLPLYFQAVLGTSPLMSGVCVLPYSIALSVAGAVVGWQIKRTGRYTVFIRVAFALLAVGFALFTNLGVRSNWAKIVLYQLVAALGIGPNFQGLLLALHTTVAHPADLASATATLAFVRQLSTSVSVVLGGVVFQNRMQAQHAALVAVLGPDAATLLTGAHAASSVDRVGDLLAGDALAVARTAYWRALQTMFIMYACLAAAGLGLSFGITHTTLATHHETQKTGLAHLRPRGAPADTPEK